MIACDELYVKIILRIKEREILMDIDDDGNDLVEFSESDAPSSGGFIKFYGLYWKREFIFTKDGVLPGLPLGWVGKGTRSVDPDTLWMNFWDQKGVYVLYDDNLVPVYAGQAGTVRKGKNNYTGRTLGQRLRDHCRGKYRNGWKYFSWFGFLACTTEKELKGNLKSADLEQRKDIPWKNDSIFKKNENNLNGVLDSFEAILIEAFIPRFNSRGGNLKHTVYVDQFEGTPKFLQGN